MKRILTMAATAIFGLAMTVGAQQAAPAPSAEKANPRAPHAYGDQDKDGKCDVTGKPVGQGRQGMQGGRGRGQQFAMSQGQGGGRQGRGGMGQGRGGNGRGRGHCQRQAHGARGPVATPAVEKN